MDAEIVVRMLPEVYQKIMFWVKESQGEVSGLGKVIHKGGAYYVTEAYLLEQENTAASTDIDAEAAAKLMYDTKDVEGHLNFWWHSHVNMSTFWSNTDKDTIKEFGENGFCLATVFNKKEDHRTCYFQGGDDFVPKLMIDDIKLGFGYPLLASQEDEWKKELEEKCRRKTFNHNHNKGGNKGKHNRSHLKMENGGTSGQQTHKHGQNMKNGGTTTTQNTNTPSCPSGFSKDSPFHHMVDSDFVYDRRNDAWVHINRVLFSKRSNIKWAMKDAPKWKKLSKSIKKKWEGCYEDFMGFPSLNVTDLENFYQDYNAFDVDQFYKVL